MARSTAARVLLSSLSMYSPSLALSRVEPIQFVIRFDLQLFLRRFFLIDTELYSFIVRIGFLDDAVDILDEKVRLDFFIEPCSLNLLPSEFQKLSVSMWLSIIKHFLEAVAEKFRF